MAWTRIKTDDLWLRTAITVFSSVLSAPSEPTHARTHIQHTCRCMVHTRARMHASACASCWDVRLEGRCPDTCCV
eukprot:105807-Alexandrium_andersonii.AAC.1